MAPNLGARRETGLFPRLAGGLTQDWNGVFSVKSGQILLIFDRACFILSKLQCRYCNAAISWSLGTSSRGSPTPSELMAKIVSLSGKLGLW